MFDNDIVDVIIDLLVDESIIVREYSLKLFDDVLLVKNDIMDYLITNNLVPLNILKNFNKIKLHSNFDKGQILGWVFAQFVLNRFLLSEQYKNILKESSYLNEIINNWIDNKIDVYYAEIIDINSFDTYSQYLKWFDVQNGLSLQLNQPNLLMENDSEIDNNDANYILYRQKSQTSYKYSYFKSYVRNTNPLHLYTVLALSDFNEIIEYNLVLKNQIWEHIILIIKNTKELRDITDEECKKLKAALYAIACLSCSDAGFNWLFNRKFEELKTSFDFYSAFIKLAEDHPNYVSSIFIQDINIKFLNLRIFVEQHSIVLI